MSTLKSLVVFTAWMAIVCAPLTCARVSAQELQHEGKPLSDWVEALSSEDDFERRQAANAIANIGRQGEEGAAATVPVLIGCLKNDVTGVRWTAVQGLMMISIGGGNASAAAPALLEALKDPEWTVRQIAIDALLRVDPKVPGLVAAVTPLLTEDPESGVRASAAGAVQQLCPPDQAVPLLIAATRDPYWGIRVRASQELGHFGADAKDAVPAILAVFTEEHEDLREGERSQLRRYVAEALGEIGPDAKPAAPALTEALADEDADVRRAAAGALVRIGEPAAAVPVLIEDLANESSWKRQEAAAALGGIGPVAASAVPALVTALKDPDSSVRTAAIHALGNLGPLALEAVPALIGTMEDEDVAVRRSAVDALGRIGPEAPQVVPTLIEALEDKDLGMYAAGALGDIGTPEAVSALVAALARDDIAYYASDALGKMGAAAAPALSEALSSDNATIRNEAAKVLRRLGPQAEPAIPALVEALQDEELMSVASQTLAGIGAAAVPALVGALEAEDMGGLYAAIALGKIGEPAVPALIEALESTNPTVRKNAAAALEKIGPAAAAAIPALTKAMEDQTSRFYAERALKKIQGE